MTDNRPADENLKRAPSRWRRPIAAVVVVGVVAAVVYATLPERGKDIAGAAGQCAASASAASRMAPFAKGEVAAMSVAKTPRPAIDVSFDTPDGKRVSLADFRGRAILLNLWATWCAPCRAEMPALDRLQAQLGSDQFEVVTVNIDTARLERRETFWKEIDIRHLAFYTDQKADIFQVLKRTGKVVGLPTTILIDSNGCELGLMAGPAEWDSEDAKRLISAAVKN